MSFADKVAIITGAGQGVGKGIAIALAKAGASIVASGRTLSKVQETIKEIEVFNCRIRFDGKKTYKKFESTK